MRKFIINLQDKLNFSIAILNLIISMIAKFQEGEKQNLAMPLNISD